ncbi:MAG: hypothetical protein HY716_12630 [Planctomycetes bacterium]|nr:hypothetical protein [Planctomycetota bacterium]
MMEPLKLLQHYCLSAYMIGEKMAILGLENEEVPRNYWFVGIACAGLGAIAVFIPIKSSRAKRRKAS